MLLLHGFLGSARNLGALMRALRRRGPSLDYHALDLPGHGSAPSLQPDASLETMASAILEQIAALGLEEPVATVGHSLGGRVALMAKRLAPGALSPIVLLDIAPGLTRRRTEELHGVAEALVSAPESTATREEMRAFLARTLSEPLVDWLLMNLKRDAEGRYRWTIDRHTLCQFDRDGGGADLWDTVDSSVLCIRGGDSTFVSDEDLQRFAERGARTVTIPGAGHFVHVDATDTVADLVLAELSPGRAAEG